MYVNYVMYVLHSPPGGLNWKQTFNFKRQHTGNDGWCDEMRLVYKNTDNIKHVIQAFATLARVYAHGFVP
jgi:hypothetical protein